MKKGILIAAVAVLAIGLVATRSVRASATVVHAPALTWEAYLPQDRVKSDMSLFQWDRISDVAPQDPLSPFQP